MRLSASRELTHQPNHLFEGTPDRAMACLVARAGVPADGSERGSRKIRERALCHPGDRANASVVGRAVGGGLSLRPERAKLCRAVPVFPPRWAVNAMLNSPADPSPTTVPRHSLLAPPCLQSLRILYNLYKMNRTDGEPRLTKLAATTLRSAFADTINRVAYQGERIALERHGKTVAALVSVEDLELLEALENRTDLAAARKALKEPGRRRWEKVKADLGL